MTSMLASANISSISVGLALTPISAWQSANHGLACAFVDQYAIRGLVDRRPIRHLLEPERCAHSREDLLVWIVALFVRCGDHPQVPVRIGEGRAVPPRLLRGLGDGLRSSSDCAFDQAVHLNVTVCRNAHDALAGARGRDLIGADDPAEPAGRTSMRWTPSVSTTANGSGTPSSAGSPGTSKPRPSRKNRNARCRSAVGRLTITGARDI